jgi:hypothetical protein
MKSGNLNFLEPSRPLQAYNGTAAFTIGLSTVTEISLEVLIHLQNIVFSVDDTWNGLTDVTKRTVGHTDNRFTMSGKNTRVQVPRGVDVRNAVNLQPHFETNLSNLIVQLRW